MSFSPPGPGRDAASFAARWPRAQAYGWTLVVLDRADQVPHAYVTAPKWFPCQRDSWASEHMTVKWGEETVIVPGYFWDDWTLRTGTHAPWRKGACDAERFYQRG